MRFKSIFNLNLPVLDCYDLRANCMVEKPVETMQTLSLGSRDKALELQKLKTNFRDQLSHKVHVPRDDLLSQTFIFDPTINIAEAARRSFVEVLDFVLFE